MKPATSRTIVTALLSAVLASAQMGCSGPRGGSSLHSLTSQVNGCAVTLPIARAAVTRRGKLVTIHPLRRGQAAQIVRTVEGSEGRRPTGAPTSVPTATGPATHLPSLNVASCIVVYRGPYGRGAVEGARQQQGRYALMIVRVRHPAVLRAFVLDRLPRGL
jgi:hypothetical protein